MDSAENYREELIQIWEFIIKTRGSLRQTWQDNPEEKSRLVIEYKAMAFAETCAAQHAKDIFGAESLHDLKMRIAIEPVKKSTALVAVSEVILDC